jgi:hypothetical protein
MEEYQVKLMDIEYDSFNWSVYEHEGASCGDRCFMVRCGLLSCRELKMH